MITQPGFAFNSIMDLYKLYISSTSSPSLGHNEISIFYLYRKKNIFYFFMHKFLKIIYFPKILFSNCLYLILSYVGDFSFYLRVTEAHETLIRLTSSRWSNNSINPVNPLQFKITSFLIFINFVTNFEKKYFNGFIKKFKTLQFKLPQNCKYIFFYLEL